jgi:hypothetical protein
LVGSGYTLIRLRALGARPVFVAIPSRKKDIAGSALCKAAVQPAAGVFRLNDNHFIELFSPAVAQQKIGYIRQNPVRTYRIGLCAEDYIYSSASNYSGIDGITDVDCLFLLSSSLRLQAW